MKLQYSLAAGVLLFSSIGLSALETVQDQAKRRISPVNTKMDVNGSVRCKGFRAGETYKITWTMMGYDNNYTAALVYFDCTGTYADFQCGASYTDAVAADTVLGAFPVAPESKASSEWTYVRSADTAYAHDFNYSVTFTVPLTRNDGSDWGTEADNNSTPVVFRWYQRAEGETLPGEPSIAVLLGAEAGYHYGTNARRIESNVSTDVDSSFVCPNPMAP